MYRVHINGVDYVAPDLPTLQKWANEGRLLPDTFVWVDSMQTHKKAIEVPGMFFPAQTQPNYAQPPHSAPVSYPRDYSYGKVNNNLILAIFSTLCCCLPFGVVSIVYASQVDGYAQRGEVSRATESAEKAKNWAIASIVCGLIGNIIVIALQFAAGSL